VELTLYLALIAGLVSFISPCVLPLVPAYVGYMGGRMTHTVATSTIGGGQTTSAIGWHQRFLTLTHSLFFIAGFTLVFVSIGLLSTAFISVIGGANISTLTSLIGRIGGVVIIFFGLHFMSVLPKWLGRIRSNTELISNPLSSLALALAGSALIVWGFSGNVLIWESTLWELAPWSPLLGLIVLAGFLVWLFLDGAFTSPAAFWQSNIDRIVNALYADTRRDMQAISGSRGYTSSALMGVVFSAGWTPCIGPVYGAVLTMAANGGDVGQAGTLLAAYSLGLGIPFMLTALALDSAQNVLRRLQRHMHRIELASGVFLVMIGIAVASGQLQNLSNQFAGQFAEFSISLEESVLGVLTGEEEIAIEPPPGSADQTRRPNTDLVVINPGSSQSGPNALDEANTAVELNSITSLADSGSPSVGISIGNLAPDFESVTDTGQPLRLSDYRGQVVLLNFWATWCGPCRVEMPEFEAVYNQHKDQGLAIVAVNNQETAARVQEFRSELDLSFPLVMDERADIQIRYNIFSYPSTFVLGRDGTIIARHFGPLTAEQIDEMVAEALAT
jgi:cytochrome c biogenesis protein CcdA/peroxiredoxin